MLVSVLEPHGVWCASVIVFVCRERMGGVLEALALYMRWEALKGPSFLLSCWFKYQVPSLPVPLDQQTALTSRSESRKGSLWTLT